MKRFRRSGKYYLKKIKNGELKPKEVADLLNVSVDTVNCAYGDYIKEQNPFNEKSFEYKKTIIEILISIISTVILLVTLFEMQAARNATYLPDVTLSSTEVAIAWDKNGLPYVSDEDMEIISKIIKEDTIVNSFPKMKVYNLGVGIAKDVVFEWERFQNIERFLNILNGNEDVEVSVDKGLVNIKTPEMEYDIWEPDDVTMDMLLNSTEEYDSLFFPHSYYQLIREVYIGTAERRIPTICLTISFLDIQGKVYEKNMQINTQISFMQQKPDGSGFCVFELIPTKVR